MFDPIIRIASALARSARLPVAAPRPHVGRARRARAVADPRLVVHHHDAERGHQLPQQIGLLVVQRGAAEQGHPERPVQRPPGSIPALPRSVARGEDPVHDHVDRDVEFKRLPVGATRSSVLHALEPLRAGDELHRRLTLRTQPTAGHGRRRISLYRLDPSVAHIDRLRAARGAERAHRRHGGGAGQARAHLAGATGVRALSEREWVPSSELLEKRPGHPDNDDRADGRTTTLRLSITMAAPTLLVGCRTVAISGRNGHVVRKGPRRRIRSGSGLNAPV